MKHKQENNLSRPLTPAEIEAFGREMEQIRAEISAELGQKDLDHIAAVIRRQRHLEITGRLLIHFSLDPLTWLAGVGLLGGAKILENMEIGHNVLHGQFDWTGIESLSSQAYEWDIVADAEQWKFSHNYLHHVFTNIAGRDLDIGYGLLRLSDDQPWSPAALLQPLYAAVLALNFEWGVGIHSHLARFLSGGGADRAMLRADFARFKAKIGHQLVKDLLLFPALAGPFAAKVAAGNIAANMVRNLWAFTIIFCGHFTDQAVLFSQADTAAETRGDWYLRQLQGSSNISGGRLLYLLSGHLSHQIEHHMFPDIPANRYEEIAPRLQAVCERYGQQYNTGSLTGQFATVVRRIVAYSFPDRLAKKLA